MLSKVLTSIVQCYNEIGIFIFHNGKIYWFDGNKNLQFWCKFPFEWKTGISVNQIKKISAHDQDDDVYYNYSFKNNSWTKTRRSFFLEKRELSWYSTFQINNKKYKLIKDGVLIQSEKGWKQIIPKKLRSKNERFSIIADFNDLLYSNF